MPERDLLVRCLNDLTRLAIEAGRDYKMPIIDSTIEDYQLEWANTDLAIELMMTADLTQHGLTMVYAAADANCFGPGVFSESVARAARLYEAGVRITGFDMDFDTIEAELAKKSA